MTELVAVNVPNTGSPCSPIQHLSNAGLTQPTLATQPEPTLIRMSMPPTLSDVAVEGSD
jgi:hypothetical protein